MYFEFTSNNMPHRQVCRCLNCLLTNSVKIILSNVFYIHYLYVRNY